jgi:hypothetical protein
MIIRVVVAFVVVAYGCAPLGAQSPEQLGPEHMILRRAVAETEATESEWRFTPAVCTCPKLIPEQRGVAVGIWQRKPPDGSSDNVAVKVYGIATIGAASRYMKDYGSGRLLAQGWKIQRVDFADDATRAIYQDGRRYHLTFRKGRFLVDVGASNDADVERFARRLLGAISLVK